MPYCVTSANSRHTATVLCTSAKIWQSRTSYVRKPLYEMPDAPRLGIEGENNGIGGIPKRK